MFVVVRHRVQSRAWRLKSILSRRQLSLGSSITSQKVQNSGDVVDSHPVTHASYQLLSTEFVAEHGVNVVMYEHTQSKAQVMSVIADDPNKVFGVTFLTPPKDSTGISHIMEHSVLCGSRKYTSKEPFAELLKGSLQTFLNAFTYPGRVSRSGSTISCSLFVVSYVVTLRARCGLSDVFGLSTDSSLLCTRSHLFPGSKPKLERFSQFSERVPRRRVLPACH